MRQIFVVLQATCAGQPLPATGGAALPAWLGALESQESGDWSLWPSAQVGDVIRVVQDVGPLAYSGWGPFSESSTDGSFTDKGLRDERVVGSAVVTLVGEEGVILDRELPSAEVGRTQLPSQHDGRQASATAATRRLHRAPGCAPDL